MRRNHLVVWASLVLLAGCQQYQRKPIDTEAILAQWRARTADSDAVRARSSQRGRAFDLHDGVSADEAVAIALVFDPRLNASRRAAAVKGAGSEHAATWPNPELEVDARRVIDGVDGDWQLGLGLGLVIPLSDRRDAERDRVTATAEAARLEILSQEWALEADVRRAWAEWSTAARRVTLLGEYARAIEPLQNAADALAAAGELEAAQAGVLAVDRLEREEEQLEAAAHEEGLRHALLARLGLRPSAPIRLTASLAVGASPGRTAAQDEQVIRRDHPEVREALARYEVAEQSVRKEIAKQFPDLVIGPSYELDAGQSAIGLGLGIPIPVINLNRRGIAVARAERDAERARMTATLERLLTRAEIARASVRRAGERARRLEERLVPAVEAQLVRLTRLAADGELDPLLVRHFFDRAHAGRLSLLNARLDLAVATVELRALVTPPARRAAGPGRDPR